MCTVSWSIRPEGYDLFFNRDELDTRAPELAPCLAQREGIAFIAPRDGDRDGTWLLANEFGLTVCLLNDYSNRWRPDPRSPRLSRGHIVLTTAGAKNIDDVLGAVRGQPLSCVPPFHLFAISTEQRLLLHWNGSTLERLTEKAVTPPLTSSSYSTPNVIATRLSSYRSFVHAIAQPLPEELFAFHRQYDSDAGAYSVLMSRSDAATRSICHVSVGNERVRVRYQPVVSLVGGPEIAAPVELTIALQETVEASGLKVGAGL